MANDFLDEKALLAHAVEQNLYGKTVAQVRKDFELANVAIALPVAITPEELFTTLHEKVFRLLMEQFTVYLNLLYVVDVPERDFKNITATDTVEVARKVAFLILKRVWQKVWLKTNYTA